MQMASGAAPCVPCCPYTVPMLYGLPRTEVAAGHMDSEQKEIYALYNETHGLTQQFYTPLNL